MTVDHLTDGRYRISHERDGFYEVMFVTRDELEELANEIDVYKRLEQEMTDMQYVFQKL